MANLETIVPLPCAAHDVIEADEIRSTTLVSSLNALQAQGMAEAYFERLNASDAALIRELVPGMWVSMRLGMSHYAAIEALGLSDFEARNNGRRVSDSVQNSYMGTLIRSLGTGITVWSLLPRFPTLFGRQVSGGACAVYKCGPKDARIEIHGVPIARYRYVRCGWAGMIEGSLELLSRKAYVADRSPFNADATAAFMLSWT